MSQFPTIFPTFTDFDGNQTLAQNNHAARHNKVHEEVAAIAAKVGIDSSTDPDSLDKKTTDLRTDVTALEADIAPLLVDPTTKAYVDAAISTAVGATKQALYPIGSYYINETDATNPGTLLGFGTWVAVANRTIVGKGSGTFATAGATGGTETETLALSQIPNVTGQAVAHASRSSFWAPSGVFSGSDMAATYAATGASTGGANSISNLNFNLGGGGGSHNNLPPYIVAYVWKRTA